MKKTPTKKSDFGKSIKISPIMIPNKKIYRTDLEGTSFIMEFNDQQVVNLYLEFHKTSGTKIAKGNDFILGSEAFGFPKGSWVYVDEDDKIYRIEAYIDINNDCTFKYK